MQKGCQSVNLGSATVIHIHQFQQHKIMLKGARKNNPVLAKMENYNKTARQSRCFHYLEYPGHAIKLNKTGDNKTWLQI